MNKEEVFDKLKQIMWDVCATEDVAEESSLLDDLGLDSLDIAEIIMETEKRFEISISDDEIEYAEIIVGRFVDIILNLLQNKNQ